MKIVLLGYMACGKSLVGKKFAYQKGIKFIDLDTYIEEKEQISIQEIFQNKGELYFRKIESDYLMEVLNFSENSIISLGGGTPCYGNNMDLIIRKATSIYLSASIETLFDRLSKTTSKRPLVASLDINNLKEYIAKGLFERRSFYDRAKFKIVVDHKSISEILSEINNLR